MPAASASTEGSETHLTLPPSAGPAIAPQRAASARATVSLPRPVTSTLMSENAQSSATIVTRASVLAAPGGPSTSATLAPRATSASSWTKIAAPRPGTALPSIGLSSNLPAMWFASFFPPASQSLFHVGICAGRDRSSLALTQEAPSAVSSGIECSASSTSCDRTRMASLAAAYIFPRQWQACPRRGTPRGQRKRRTAYHQFQSGCPQHIGQTE